MPSFTSFEALQISLKGAGASSRSSASSFLGPMHACGECVSMAQPTRTMSP